MDVEAALWAAAVEKAGLNTSGVWVVVGVWWFMGCGLGGVFVLDYEGIMFVFCY